jgi:hypothetical protein
MRFCRAVGWPLALTAALAPALFSQAQSTRPDEDRAGWMLGVNAQADEHDAHSLYATSYVGVGSRTWLTFAAGKSSSPIESTDIEANTILLGVDHRFDKVGFTLEAEQWGRLGRARDEDYSGRSTSIATGGASGSTTASQHRDSVHGVGPVGPHVHAHVDLAADGVSFDANVALAERWRGVTSGSSSSTTSATLRVAADRRVELLSASTLTLAKQLPRSHRFIAVERDVGIATLLSLV